MKILRTGIVIVCLSLIISLIFPAKSDAEINPESIVGIWMFDEGSGKIARDASGNDNDGEILGKLKWVDGKFGKALEFNGVDSYVDCGDVLTHYSGPFTSAAWIRPVNHKGEWNTVFGETCSGFTVTVAREGRIQFGQNCGPPWVIGPVLEEGQWVHVAIVVSDNHTEGYLNGEKIGESDGLAYTHANFFIGIFRLTDEPWEGSIDEVAVFKEALTADEIKNIMAKGLFRALIETAVKPLGKLATAWGKIKKK